MWKNKKHRTLLTSVKVTYEIVGLNQDNLISELKKRGFTLYQVKKFSNRVMRISVNLQESKNFFAITKNLCYNVKKVGTFGKGLPIYKLVKNLGLAVGAIVFLVLSVISNDFLFELKYSGSGSIYSRQVGEYLENRGITRFARFSSFELDKLEDDILAENPNLTFVSANKRGNTLELYLALKTNANDRVNGKRTELVSSCAGVVESIKIYRGRAVVAVGDSVKKGDLLVEGVVEIKEQAVQTGVLAYITVLNEQVFEYRLKRSDGKELALALAGEELSQKEIVDSVVTVKEISGKKGEYIYTVKATYRTVIST